MAVELWSSRRPCGQGARINVRARPLPDGFFWGPQVAASAAIKKRFGSSSPGAIEWDPKFVPKDVLCYFFFDLGRFLAEVSVLQREYVREM